MSKNINQHNIKNKIGDKQKRLKGLKILTSKGRQIIKPKKLLTTSSDEKQKKRKIIIKRKPDMHEELCDLKSYAAQSNILRDITSSSMQNSKLPAQTLEMPHYTTNVLSHKIPKLTNENDEDCCAKSSTKNVTLNNISHISGINSHTVSEYGTNATNNTNSNNHNKKMPRIINIEQIPIVFQNDSQKPECQTKSTSNDTSQNEIIKLLRQVVAQNSKLLSDIKTLKEYHTLPMKNDLYKRPEGFPLKTIEEFKEVETDTDRLQELQAYLKFVGGIKLREALSHFQKETMTDELVCKFTYWGRTKESLPFYNTQIAKVFFSAAKMCPHFKGPETRAEFKLEVMEVFRAAKQRQYLKSNKNENTVTSEAEEILEDDLNNHTNTETEDHDASDEISDLYD